MLFTELIDIYRENNEKYTVTVCGEIQSSLTLQFIYIYLPLVITTVYSTHE